MKPKRSAWLDPIRELVIDAAFNALEVQRGADRTPRRITPDMIRDQLRDWEGGILPPPKDLILSALWGYFAAVEGLIQQGRTPFRMLPIRPQWPT